MPLDLFDYPHDYIPGDVIKENLYNKLRLEPDLTKQRSILRQFNFTEDIKIYAPTVYEGKKYGKHLQPKYNIIICLLRCISILCLSITTNWFIPDYFGRCYDVDYKNQNFCTECLIIRILQIIANFGWIMLGIYDIARYIDIMFTSF